MKKQTEVMNQKHDLTWWVLALLFLLSGLSSSHAYAGGDEGHKKSHYKPAHASKAFSTSTATSNPNSNSSSNNSSGDTTAIGLGSASPSANACQGVFFFGFTYTVAACARQEWTRVLQGRPSQLQLEIACRDPYVWNTPTCLKVYPDPAPPAGISGPRGGE